MPNKWFCLFVLTLFAGCQALDPQFHLENWVENEKSKLPRKVDRYVTCVDMESADEEVIFYYRVSELTDWQAKIRQEAFRQKTETNVRSHRSQFQQAIDYKIQLTHVFRNAAGSELFRFTIKPWDL